MKKMWKEFRAFALGGNMLDLALGFLIATEFARVVDPIANTLLDEILAAIFGKTNFSRWHFSINHQHIDYGLVLAAFINFVFFASMLFLVLKAIAVTGLGRQRDFEERQCPYCLEYVTPHALVCKTCRQPLVAQLPDIDTALARAAKLRERRHLNLPIDLREFDLPDINLSKLRRRANAARPKSAETTTTTGVAVIVTQTSPAEGAAAPNPDDAD